MKCTTSSDHFTRCKGYIFSLVPEGHLLLSSGTLQGSHIHKGPPLWEQKAQIKVFNHKKPIFYS